MVSVSSPSLCALLLATSLVGYVLSSGTAQEELVQVVLDDLDSEKMMNAFEGDYEPCMEDAYNQHFHHDGAVNKGSSSFTFHFDAPKSGCYKIEEYHPGSDWACSRYLPRSVHLDVGFGEGDSTQLFINQAVHGGKWTEIASLPFSEGHRGELVLRNSPNDECSAETCFWVADALRLTWTGDSCLATDPYQRSGVLTFNARSNGSIDDDLQPTLLAHIGVFETMLEIKLGAPKVNVLHIGFAPGRRLQDSSNRAFEVRFEAYGASNPPLTVSTGLKQALQESFSAAGVGVIFESASLRWSVSSQNRQEQGDDEITNSLVVIVLLAASASVFVLCTAFLLVRTYARRGQLMETEGSALQKDIEAMPADEQKGEKKEREEASTEPVIIEAMPTEEVKLKKQDTWEMRSVSTGPGADVSQGSEAETFEEQSLGPMSDETPRPQDPTVAEAAV